MESFSSQIMGDPTIDDLIEASYEANSQEWRDAAIQAVWEICTMYQTFNSDAVRDRLALKNIQVKNMSGLGGVMNAARDNKWCEWKGDSEPSLRPSSHRRLVRKWTSLIYSPF